jgi:serpin B
VGLEGAAATAVVMRMLSMHRDLAQPIEVKVDRPFLFLVRHRPSGAIYFLARVVQP